MGSLTEFGEIATEPKFEEADNTSNHGGFALGGGGQVDFNFVFEDVGVDPNRDLFFFVQEDHVLIDYEEAVDGSQSHTGF